MKRGQSFLLFCVMLISFFTLPIFAQPSDVISRIEYGEAIANQPLEISAELFSSAEISSIFIFFRNFGESEFVRREMEIRGTTAYGIIPAEYVTPPSLEYYLIITLTSGTITTYPLGSPDQIQPERITIKAEDEKVSDVLILTPAEGEKVSTEELLVTLSFIKAPPEVDPKATKIYLSGTDVTEYALFAEDLIIFSGSNFPETIQTQNQLLKVEVYDNLGNLKSTTSRSFVTVSKSYLASLEGQFKYNINLKGESRNENYNEETTWYNNLDARFKGRYDNWNFDAKVYATSEEKSYRQPQNRYSAKVSTDWLNLSFGDSYPVYPEMILSGKRVRGIDAGINLGSFSLQASYGQVTRGIEGAYLQGYPVDSTSALLSSDVIDVDEAKYGFPYARVELGEYSRNIFAIRPSFKAGESFEFGLTMLRGGDDKNSIEFGTGPEQNLVFGTDMKWQLDERRLEISGQAAISFYNADISTGTLTDTQIDSVFGGDGVIDVDPDVVKTFKSLFGNFMDINQFFGPWNIEELSSLAAEAAVGLNYFNNNLKMKYIYRGNDYTSFGQTYLRTDVAGFNVVDRIRMIENKVFLSLGYERLEDNLQDTKIATTTYQTLNTSVSVYAGEGIPNFTLGYTRYDNSNDLEQTDSTYYTSVVNDATNKFYAQLSHEFELEIPHRVNLYLSTSSREDNSLRNNDANNFSFSFNLRSEWSKIFTSHAGATYYTSESASLPYDYSSIFLGGTVYLLKNKLDLTATFSPSFGDFERQAFDLLGNYNVIENLTLSLQVRFYRIPDVSTNSIIGLITRYTL